MASHSSILAWRIPWTEKSGELQSMGSQRVRHNQSASNCMKSESVSHMDCDPPGSSVHGILQARILEWLTVPFSRGSS